MKITITSDNHVNWFKGLPPLTEFMDKILATKPEVVLNLGDLGDGGLSPSWVTSAYNIMLGTFSPTLFVVGNHDLYNVHKQHPDISMELSLRRFKSGIPLQTKWDDRTTVFVKDDCCFVGAMGFPDLDHPLMFHRKSSLNKNFSETIDARYIDIDGGWVFWNMRSQNAFYDKLDEAIKTDCKNIVVATHYPILEGQYPLSGRPFENISAYFFNYSMGLRVLELAKENPDRQIFCFAGHAHQFCAGKWFKESENVVSYGLDADYKLLKFVELDTDISVDQLISGNY
jgi:hypothetical protein